MPSENRVSAREVVQRMKDEEIRFLDLKFVDLFGTLQHLTLPAELVDEVDAGVGRADRRERCDQIRPHAAHVADVDAALAVADNDHPVQGPVAALGNAQRD